MIDLGQAGRRFGKASSLRRNVNDIKWAADAHCQGSGLCLDKVLRHNGVSDSTVQSLLRHTTQEVTPVFNVEEGRPCSNPSTPQDSCDHCQLQTIASRAANAIQRVLRHPVSQSTGWSDKDGRPGVGASYQRPWKTPAHISLPSATKRAGA